MHPFRLRVVSRERGSSVGQDKIIPIDRLRTAHRRRTWLRTSRALLAGGAAFGGRPVRAADIAVIVEKHRDARALSSRP